METTLSLILSLFASAGHGEPSWIHQLFGEWPMLLLLSIIAVTLYILGTGADILVEEAVSLSTRWGVPKVMIGATIVSLGTTTPEAAVSVLAAFKGSPDLALGNAVGSIICDTGLILGLATLISPLPLDRKIVNRQGWIQIGAGFVLILGCVPYSNISGLLESGGRFPQWIGFVFLLLLAIYLWLSVKWSTGSESQSEDEATGTESTFVALLKLIGGIVMVVGSAHFLIPAVEIIARRLHIPQSIIAATLVAFGTSLPELVTAITAARKGQGELAVGNIIGADILNVLFVAGAAAAVTPEGLPADKQFFILQFPAMILVLVVFRLGISLSKDKLKRPFGLVLLATYLVVTILSYIFGSQG